MYVWFSGAAEVGSFWKAGIPPGPRSTGSTEPWNLEKTQFGFLVTLRRTLPQRPKEPLAPFSLAPGMEAFRMDHVPLRLMSVCAVGVQELDGMGRHLN